MFFLPYGVSKRAERKLSPQTLLGVEPGEFASTRQFSGFLLPPSGISPLPILHETWVEL